MVVRSFRARRLPLLLGLILSYSVFGVGLKTALAQSIPFSVYNNSSVARINADARASIPLDPSLANERIYNTQNLSVTLNAVPVPADFEVLSRASEPNYRAGAPVSDTSKPIRWLLVRIPTSIAARAATEAQAKKDFVLHLGTPASVTGALMVSESSNDITVQPGSGIQFIISKTNSALIDSAVINGTPMLASPITFGMQELNLGSASAVQSSAVVLRAGTSTALIRKQGSFGSTGLTYTVYLEFVAQSAQAKFSLVLTNPMRSGVQSNTRYVQKLGVDIPLTNTGVLTTPFQLVSTSSYSIRQQYTHPSFTPGVYDLNMLDNFNWLETISGTSTNVSGMFPGAIDISNNSGNGATLAIEKFAERFENEIALNGSTASLLFFPNGTHESHAPYNGGYGVPVSSCQSTTPAATSSCDPNSSLSFRFPGGGQLSHVGWIKFHTAQAATLQSVSDYAVAVNYPLQGLRSDLTSLTPYLLEPASVRQGWSDPALQRFDNKFNQMIADDNAADNISGIGRVGLNGYRARGGTYGSEINFGKENFGDISWGDGYSNLHYDWVASTLTNFLRTNDMRFLLLGSDMAVARRDWGQNHSTSSSDAKRGFANYEKGWWHGNYGDYSYTDIAHTWIHGLILHYLLTGDPITKSAVQESLDSVKRSLPGSSNGHWSCEYGDRIAAQYINNNVEGAFFFGDSTNLARAAVWSQDALTCEQLSGGQGYINNLATTYGNIKPWMLTQLVVALVNYAEVSLDSSFDSLINRIKNFLVNVAYIPGSGSTSSYLLPKTYYCLILSNGTPTLCPGETDFYSRHHLNALAHAFSRIARYQADSSLLTLASDLFEFAVLYYDYSSPSATVNRSSSAAWSLVSMRSMSFPNSSSKVIGDTLLWLQPALEARRQVLGIAQVVAPQPTAGAAAPTPIATPVPSGTATATPTPAPTASATPITPTATSTPLPACNAAPIVAREGIYNSLSTQIRSDESQYLQSVDAINNARLSAYADESQTALLSTSVPLCITKNQADSAALLEARTAYIKKRASLVRRATAHRRLAKKLASAKRKVLSSPPSLLQSASAGAPHPKAEPTYPSLESTQLPITAANLGSPPVDCDDRYAFYGQANPLLTSIDSQWQTELTAVAALLNSALQNADSAHSEVQLAQSQADACSSWEGQVLQNKQAYLSWEKNNRKAVRKLLRMLGRR
ncbi:MAG: hypothetical protein K1X79_05075 [Oligoflexia bacterium]|nr:hypothetical protein [Oligoflexia bacterium]